MKRLLIFFSLLILHQTQASENDVKRQIFDFDTGYEGVVTITNSDNNDTCVGALIHSEWVLTSALCALKTFYKEMRIIIGNNNTFEGAIHIRNTYIHPEYDNEILENDIALLELARPADEFARILKIPKKNSSLIAKKAKVLRLGSFNNPSNTELDYKPWGSFVYFDNVIIINNELCERYPVYLSKSRLCTFEAIACEGDEGAPLVTINDELLVGLVSVSAVQAAMCTYYQNNCLFPVTTYTSVVPYRPWIREVTELNIL